MATTAQIEHTPTERVTNWITEANAARQDYERAGTEYAKYVTSEAEKEAHRPQVKQEATLRIMVEQKVAATNAEKLASVDPVYLSHLEAQRDTVYLKNDACTRMHSARIRAELAIAAIRSLAGFA